MTDAKLRMQILHHAEPLGRHIITTMRFALDDCKQELIRRAQAARTPLAVLPASAQVQPHAEIISPAEYTTLMSEGARQYQAHGYPRPASREEHVTMLSTRMTELLNLPGTRTPQQGAELFYTTNEYIQATWPERESLYIRIIDHEQRYGEAQGPADSALQRLRQHLLHTAPSINYVSMCHQGLQASSTSMELPYYRTNYLLRCC